MKRQHLISIVRQAAAETSLPADLTDQLVAVVADQRVVSVGRRMFFASGLPHCPVACAGLVTPIEYEFADERLRDFASEFDSLTRVESRNDGEAIVIEIED